MELLEQLCGIHAPSGNEAAMKEFILEYVSKEKKHWIVQPEIFSGEQFQDCIVLVFGKKPRTAIFAHMDSIGFTVKYGNEIVKIGGPKTQTGYKLTGSDSKGPIECEMDAPEGSKKSFYTFEREIERGTDLVFKCDFRQSKEYIQSCYMDNRLGCWNALKVAETLEEGIICFSTYEEVGGGSVGFLGKFIYEKYGIQQALISDITWITKGVKDGKGVVISMRDRGIPRRIYINQIIHLADQSGIDYQLEVEDAGGSDGLQLQAAPYPFDWCFIGAAEDNVHTPDEKVHRHDIDCMVKLYQYLMKHL
ncbi:aminopeptidase [Limibacter armeniacum]|uniref:aminopeptidase n=1 Tax=Limibacter armeniacum TaxID=466084 RepID=UPI002FE565FA